MAVKNETNIENLKINYLSEDDYSAALEAGEILENEIYMTPATDISYVHPDSGVVAGTYKSVTVNSQGHVTGGTNPTTLSGYGIEDAATIEQGNKADTAVQSVKIGTTEYKSGTSVVLPEYPSNLSELTNDVGFKTTDNNTTYSISKNGNTITLTGSDGSTSSVFDSDTVITVDSSLSDTSTNPVQNSVIKAEFNTVNEAIDSIKDAKADWNQNDETAVNYIKNRPFSEAPGQVQIASYYYLDVSTKYDDTYYVVNLPSSWDGCEESDIITVEIMYNYGSAVSYTNVPVNTYYIGAGMYQFDYLGDAEGYPFKIAKDKMYFTESGTYHVRIYKEGTIITTIPTKFLPNNLVYTESLTREINDAIKDKVDKVDGKGLSTNDYTTAEKNKLSWIESNAEVNQNAFSNVTIGTTTIVADSKTDTLTLVAGSNIILTPDEGNDEITIAATDTTYDNATTSSAGLMSAIDKAKLDSIEEGANNYTYTLSTASSTTLGGVKIGTNVNISSGVISVADGSTSSKGVVQLTNSTSSTSTTTAATPNSVKTAYDLANTAKSAAATAQSTADSKANASHTHTVSNISDLTATADELNYMDGVTSNVQTQLDGKAASGHTHNAATTSANGFMTSAMVTKLNGIATGATKVIVDSALSTTSTNPVQNKIVATSISTMQEELDSYVEITEDEIVTLFG